MCLSWRGIFSIPWIVLLCFSAFDFAHAEQADRKKPIQIEADAVTYDDLKQVSVFTGHVIMIQGTTVIRGDRIETRQDPQGYQYASAFADPGKLASFREKRDSVDEYIEGYGERIDYDGKQQIVLLTTRALVKRLAGIQLLDEVHGSVIRYDAYNEVYSAVKGPDQVSPNNPKGRVRATLIPQNKTTPNNAKSTPGSASGLSLKPSSQLNSRDN